MPTLLRHGRIETGPAPDALPWDAWLAQYGAGEGEAPGIVVGVEQEPDALAPHLDRIPSIAIDFPAFNDGRGLSLAVLLRTRFGYRGELRAVGAVHEDLTRYLLRCGFDSLLLPDGRDVATALAAFSLGEHYYQGSVRLPEPAFRRLRRGT